MGREIETKLPLQEEQFMQILNLIYRTSLNEKIILTEPALVFKSDEYYSQYKTGAERLSNEPRVIRIRTEKKAELPDINGKTFSEIRALLLQMEGEKSDTSRAFFTIKNKTIENGIELNREDETFIQDPDVLRAFFKGTRFDLWFCKKKIAFGASVKSACAPTPHSAKLAPHSKTLASYNDRDIPIHGGTNVMHREANSNTVGANVIHEQQNPHTDRLAFRLELELVNGLPYVEIEYTGETEIAQHVRAELETLLAGLGLGGAKKDSRSWAEIIGTS